MESSVDYQRSHRAWYQPSSGTMCPALRLIPRQGFQSHPWDGENLWLISIGQTSPSPNSYLNTMSSPQITHIPSLGPYELHPRSFDDSSPLFITDYGFVSHASTKVCQHPIWRPDWFRVKCSEITAGLFNKSMEIHFPLDRI